MDRKPTPITIETSTIVRILFLIMAFVGVVWLADRLQTQLVWVAVAIFLAVSLDPAVNNIGKWLKIGRLWSTSIVFALFVAFISFLSASLVPPLINQTQAFASQLPDLVQQAEASDTYISHVIRDYNLVERAREVQDDLVKNLATGNGTALGILMGIFNGLAAILTILTFTFFMLLEGPRWIKVLGKYVPLTRRPRARHIATRMYDIVAGYTNGNLLIAAGVGILTSAILILFGVPYAIPLGIFSGIMTLIPIVGVVIGIAVIGGVALFTSVTAAIAITGFLFFYSLIDGNIVRPLVFGRTIQMSPLMILMAILFGTALGGLVGAIVAIPVTACLGVLFEQAVDYESHKHPKKA